MTRIVELERRLADVLADSVLNSPHLARLQVMPEDMVATLMHEEVTFACLNDHQQEAIIMALRHRICLISRATLLVPHVQASSFSEPRVSSFKASPERRLPMGCPHTEEELIKKARDFPDLVACPAGDPSWWWATKRKCATKCPGHPDCIRNLYWTESGVPTRKNGSQQLRGKQ